MEKENNTIKFIYNKEEFSFKITSDSNLNYLYIKDLIINKFQIKIPPTRLNKQDVLDVLKYDDSWLTILRD